MSMSTNTFRRIATLILAATASVGCGSSGPRTVSTADDAAVLHLYRSAATTMRDSAGHHVCLDGARVGRLNTLEAFDVRVVPGTRELSIVPETNTVTCKGGLRLSVDAAARSHHYIRYAST